MKPNYTHTCNRCGQSGIPNSMKKSEHKCEWVYQKINGVYTGVKKRVQIASP